MADNYKYGFFNPDKRLTKDWDAVDFLINNNQLYNKQSKKINPLIPLTKNQHVSYRYILYALFDLSNEHRMNRFIQSLIVNKVNENRDIYDQRIKKKLINIKHKAIDLKYANVPYYGNNQPFLEKKKTEETIRITHELKDLRISKKNKASLKFSNGHFDVAIGHLMWSDLIELDWEYKSTKSARNNEDKQLVRYYKLTKLGLKLKRKFESEHYLI